MTNERLTRLTLPSCDDKPLWDAFLSVWQLRAVGAADQLGLFDILRDGPADVTALSEKLALGPRATESLVGMVTAQNLLVQRDGRFHLTDVARNFLLKDSPYYWGGIFNLLAEVPFKVSELIEALRRDKPQGLGGVDLWERNEVDPEQARVFTRAMHSHSFPAAMGMALRADFSGVTNLLDVAGGSGCFCIALAARYPDITFTVAELATVCELAEEYAAQYGLQDRIATMPFDMFHDTWPAGYDGMFFSNIFHDWGWARCEHLATNCFEALEPGGRIFLHEMLLEDTKDGPLTAAAFSLSMSYFTEGKQYTARELTDLLSRAGFTDITVTPTYGYYSIVSGRKP